MKAQIALTTVAVMLYTAYLHHAFTSDPEVVQVLVPVEVPVVRTVKVTGPECVHDMDCMILAEAIYHESRGEHSVGQEAVAHVIMNRVRSEYFPDTVHDVINHRCQFVFTCDGSQQRGITDLHSWQQAMIVAMGVLQGTISDPTGGADHYLNVSHVKIIPRWAEEYETVAVIGNHQFHKRG